MTRAVGAALVLTIFSAGASAQSLGAVAKKERERRERNKDNGVEARTISEEEIFGEPEPSLGAASRDAEERTEPSSDSSNPERPVIPERVDIDLSESRDGEPSSDGDDEGTWRARLHEARTRVAIARERKALLDEIHYVPGMSYVDENGTPVIESLADLRALVAKTDSELAEAEKDLDDLLERARREGVPPGWLR